MRDVSPLSEFGKCSYICWSTRSSISLCLRGLGLTIAVVLLLAFVERPSSLSVSSDPRHRSPSWEPPCGLTESIEMVCLVIFSLDLAVKVKAASWIKRELWHDVLTPLLFLCLFPTYLLIICPFEPQLHFICFVLRAT